jgi:hypothetical protein
MYRVAHTRLRIFRNPYLYQYFVLQESAMHILAFVTCGDFTPLPKRHCGSGVISFFFQNLIHMYPVFRAQADWTLTHTSHKDTEQSTIQASDILDGVTWADWLLRWSPNEWPSVCREIPVSADKMFSASNKPAQWTLFSFLVISDNSVHIVDLRLSQRWLMNSSFCDITPCIPLKVNQHFGGICRLHLQVWRISWVRNQRENSWQAEAGFSLGLVLDLEDGGGIPPKHRLTCNELHGVISQKIEIFFMYTLFNCSERNTVYLKSVEKHCTYFLIYQRFSTYLKPRTIKMSQLCGPNF